MSVWARETGAAKIAVVAPTIAMTVIAKGARRSIGLNRTSRKGPALTIVAACISAETGVGASIANGSHTCSGTWADLPIAPTRSNSGITVVAGTAHSRPAHPSTLTV